MLPGLTQLELSPEIFRLLFEDLSVEEAKWKPSPSRWSIAEVVEHLSHVEGHGFRSRIDQILSEESPKLKAYDQEALAAAGQYSGREIEDSFDHWEDQRESNIEYLRTLDAGVLDRRGMHEKLGMISIADLLHEWAFHDLGHIRQVAELVRAVRYYPHMGSFREIYQIKP